MPPLTSPLRDVRRPRWVVDEPILVLLLSFDKKITQRVDVITEAFRQLTPDGAGLDHDGIVLGVHGVTVSVEICSPTHGGTRSFTRQEVGEVR